MSNIFKDIMTEQGLDDGREGLPRTKNSEQLESNYIERMSSISSESRLKRRIMIIDDNSDIGLTLRMGLELGDKTLLNQTITNSVLVASILVR